MMFKSLILFAAIAISFVAAASKCDSCNGYKKCAYGYTCQDKKCVKLQPVGYSCAKACAKCKHPYFCKNGKCRVADIPCGGKCSKHGKARCEKGSYCNGRKCIKNAKKGDKCDNCKVCVNGLKCQYGYCVKKRY